MYGKYDISHAAESRGLAFELEPVVQVSRFLLFLPVVQIQMRFQNYIRP